MWSILLYFPYPGVLLCILFLDAVAAGLYAVDISYTHGIQNWFFAIGGRNYPVLDKLNLIYSELYTMLPSLKMFIIFSRCIVFISELAHIVYTSQISLNSLDQEAKLTYLNILPSLQLSNYNNKEGRTTSDGNNTTGSNIAVSTNQRTINLLMCGV
ncbi:hypothetical protein FQR65_LT00971 [Abscondita terminalis]|nr:hypothetical protein FQR65_LT00971 [Abscondita terminalis]